MSKRLSAALKGAALLAVMFYAAMLTVMSGDTTAIGISATCGGFMFCAAAVLIGLSEGGNNG